MVYYVNWNLICDSDSFFLSIFPETEAYRAFRALGLFTSHFFIFH